MAENYNQLMEKELEKIKETGDLNHKPRLLLHACCGPCSSACIERLCEVFDITIYYYNPNIHPENEYRRRLEELKRFVKEFPPAIQSKVSVIEDDYDPKDFFDATNVEKEVELKTEREKGIRCGRCYEFRMKRSWDYAVKNSFDYFTTTLSISPHKDSEKINNIGKMLFFATFSEDEVSNINEKHPRFLFSDFKKKGGFLRSLELSDEYGLYRQDYCGCVFSQRQTGNADN